MSDEQRTTVWEYGSMGAWEIENYRSHTPTLPHSHTFLPSVTTAGRILYFAPRECWPLNTGAKLRNYHLSRELGRN
ncbi:MAG TPA: hypothetical protein VID27_19880, partial [Blastocatellia bacterium]